MTLEKRIRKALAAYDQLSPRYTKEERPAIGMIIAAAMVCEALEGPQVHSAVELFQARQGRDLGQWVKGNTCEPTFEQLSQQMMGEDP